MDIKEALTLAFEQLEDLSLVKYTKKYNRQKLIEIILSQKNFNHINRYILCDKPQQARWRSYLIREFADYKECLTCNNVYPLADFSVKTSKCKVCDNKKTKDYRLKNIVKCRNASKLHYLNNKKYYKARNAINKSRLREATPAWANLQEISKYYINTPQGYEVDHIIPLKGKIVSGLHVLNNLQYLTVLENKVKSNKYAISSFG